MAAKDKDKKPLQTGLVRAGGAPEGYDAKLLADLVRRAEGPVLHIARDDARLTAMADSLRIFAPDLPILRFPAWDCLPYDRVSPNPEVSAARMATLAALARGWDRESIVITTLNAVSQRIPPKQAIRAASFTAKAASRIDPDELTRYLSRNGYVRASTVVEPGDYAVRGGIIDVFPPGRKVPLRMDFFGDVLESIKRFDPASQRSANKIDRIALAPVSEAPLDEESIQRFRTRYRDLFGSAGMGDPLYEAVSEGRKASGHGTLAAPVL